MYKCLILNYSKKIGKSDTKKVHSEETISGNVVLTVTEEFINRFNVSVYVDLFPFIQERESYTYTRKDGKLINYGKNTRKARLRRGELLVEINRIKNGADILDPRFSIEREYIRFPIFFNRWMIDNALYQILKNATDFEKLRFKVNGGESYEIIGDETGYGSVKLSTTMIKGEQPYHHKWGENTFLQPLKLKKQQIF
jgi:hypothetical protein